METSDRGETPPDLAERMTAAPVPDGEDSAVIAEVPVPTLRVRTPMPALPARVNSDSAAATDKAARVAVRAVLRRRSASWNTPCVSTRMATAN